MEDYGQHIWFEDILDELNRYSFEQKTHFDAVAALGMVMLANEELGDIVATKAVTAQDVGSFVDIGYYYDEKGYKRFGAIPKPRAAPQVKMSLSD